MQMFDQIDSGDRVEARGRKWGLLDRKLADVQVKPPGVSRGRLRQFQPGDLPASVPGLGEEQTMAAPHVEHPAGRKPALN
jgi:hypothetical protein